MKLLVQAAKLVAKVTSPAVKGAYKKIHPRFYVLK